MPTRNSSTGGVRRETFWQVTRYHRDAEGREHAVTHYFDVEKDQAMSAYESLRRMTGWAEGSRRYAVFLQNRDAWMNPDGIRWIDEWLVVEEMHQEQEPPATTDPKEIRAKLKGVGVSVS